MHITHARLNDIIKKAMVSIAGVAMVAAFAAAPASAEGETSGSSQGAAAATHEDGSIVDALQRGTFTVDAPAGTKFEVDANGKVALVADDGRTVELTSTIKTQEVAYRGEWSTQDGASATFSVTQTQGASSVSAATGQVQAQGGWATCVVKNTAAASIIAAVVGIATGPGEVAVVPITMVSALAVYGIYCASE